MAPVLALLLAAAPGVARAQRAAVSVDAGGVSVHLPDSDIRSAVQTLARFLDRPVVFGAVGGVRVSLETPRPVPASQIPGLLRSMLEAVGHELIEGPDAYRVQMRETAPPPAAPAAATPAMGGGGDVQLHVIHLRHARAADVAATVNALYGRASALGEPGSSPQTLNQQLRDSRIPPGGIPAAQPAPATSSGNLSDELVMVPDERTNSLLVRAAPGDLQLIQQAVAQLDTRPLQVLIEVVIAEVKRTSSFSLGLSAVLDSTRLHGHSSIISGRNNGLADLSGFVLSLTGAGGDMNVNLALAAAAERGEATIVSRPLLLAGNNEAAEVVVGDEVPFVQLQRTLPTDNGVRDQVVQYRDVATQLNVRPTISDDGYVTLQVIQQLNDVNNATVVRGVQAPVISTRSLSTRLLVRDGATAVLGGLSRRRRESTRGGIPLLSSIPVVGWIFGATTRDSDDTELFVFLTPRVIRDDAAMAAATNDVTRAAPRATKATAKLPSAIHPPAPKGAASAP